MTVPQSPDVHQSVSPSSIPITKLELQPGAAPGVDNIPLVDLDLLKTGNPEDEKQFYDALRSALFDYGFLYIKGAITQDDIEEAIGAAKTFFALPLATKLLLDARDDPHFRGYMHLCGEVTQFKSNLRENLDFGFDEAEVTDPSAPLWQRVLEGPNRWPDPALLPNFRAPIERYFTTCHTTSLLLFRHIVRILGCSESHIQRLFVDNPPFLFAKLAFYPALSEEEERNQPEGFVQGIGPHRDAGSWLTLLVQDEPGLQVQRHDGTWLDAPPVPGTIVANIGLPLELFTHGAARATTHRVDTRQIRRGRTSLPYFLMPNFSTPLSQLPLSSLLAAGVPVDKRFVTDADSSWNGEELRDLGERWMLNRTKQYPEVAKKYWPELVEKYGVK
ncbi:Clavaminate synthase-like protein [Gonapodya prolifera JEL478]|uniref:Clavaminate synthase-like protein n=1 Tax=Gonapodya prolifera (strain JEL478) TaxID=1344416 RepID=A0A139AFX2_GONPJ|nr:Clavaminate synthase-like protein [Gonapodya prolifera JEL478]|eukprot:KXS15696.1 Clavaminate synthase-like protein [Gonapodya prolifera JEL478]